MIPRGRCGATRSSCFWPKGKFFLVVAEWLVAIPTSAFLHGLARWIRRSRKRVRWVNRGYFSFSEQEDLKLLSHKKTDGWIVAVMMTAVIFGAVFATFAILG